MSDQTNYINALNWGTSAGAETDSTLYTDRADYRIPPDQYHASHLQLARFRQLLLAMSQYFAGGNRVRIIPNAANQFGVSESGIQLDANGNLQVIFNGGSPNAIIALSGTAKGDLVVYTGSVWARQSVGTNGQALVADSTQTNGVKYVSPGGDLSGTFTSTTVAKVQGVAVSSTAPTVSAQVFGYVSASTNWAPLTLGGDVTPTLSGGTTISLAVAKIQGTAVSASAPSTDGQILQYVAGSNQWQAGNTAVGLIQHQTATISLATMQAAGAVTTANFAIGAALPTNARIVRWYVGGTGMTSLDDATHATWNAAITAVVAGDIMANVNVSASVGNTNARVGTNGSFGIEYSSASGAQIYLTISSSVNLSTLTVGAMPVHLFYVILP